MESTIQIKTTTGWADYCSIGIPAFADADGTHLHTGDIVEIIDILHREYPVTVTEQALVVADEHTRFIRTSEPYVSGWLGHKWETDKYAVRKIGTLSTGQTVMRFRVSP